MMLFFYPRPLLNLQSKNPSSLQFLKDGIKLPECKLNDAIDISFNMKGKVEMIRKA